MNSEELNLQRNGEVCKTFLREIERKLTEKDRSSNIKEMTFLKKSFQQKPFSAWIK